MIQMCVKSFIDELFKHACKREHLKCAEVLVNWRSEVVTPTIINQVLNNAFLNNQYNVVLWLYSNYSAIIDLCHHKQILKMFYLSCQIF